jgi:TRAP-type transport system periplasmic protein
MLFRAICCLSVFIVLTLGKAAVAQEIRISHQWPSTDGRDRATRVFVQEVESRVKGLKFRVYPNSSLMGPNDQLAALQNNTLEMAVFPLSYAVSKVREFSLARLPGLVPNLQAAQALKGSEIHATLQSIAAANGIRIVTWWWAPGGFFAKNREITDPSSVRGLKMRGAEPLFEQMLKEAGASIASMPSTDVQAAMKAGALDAIGTTYEAFMSLRLYEQVKFATIGSPNLFMGFSPLMMSLASWNKLTPEQRAAIEEAAEISDAYFEAIQQTVERHLVSTLRKEGVAIRQMSREDYLSWVQLAQQTAWVEYTKINPQARELLIATVRTFVDRLDAKADMMDGTEGEGPK